MDALDGKARRPARLCAEDWMRAAFDALCREGLSAVAVEPLARQLGVTKGSFYWHFKTRDALLAAVLERWVASEQDRVFDRLDAISDPRERLRELFLLVAAESREHVVYTALLQGLDHPLVRDVMERVSQKRQDYIATGYRQTGMDPTEALHRARLTYAAYVGFIQMAVQLHRPRLRLEEYKAYVEHVMRTLIP
ncbi:MAG: TetR/AcrR family transcriptional regulator [Proteobacteria bacterium]|nr:TetR/AcrR family transcriptional regulator [Pseudomonadota bacterium]